MGVDGKWSEKLAGRAGKWSEKLAFISMIFYTRHRHNKGSIC